MSSSKQTQIAAKRDTKQDIFLASIDLFAERGFREVSVRDIAKAVGIKPSSIYNHYASKELIMNDMLDYYLERMQRFQQRLILAHDDLPAQEDLSVLLERIALFYEPHEVDVMYKLTRIVHHEQFHFDKAAEALIGEGYRQYVGAHISFFDKLSQLGHIQGTEHNQAYGELYARLSLTFATQFLHPEIEPTIKNQTELYRFVNQLVVSYEASLKGK